MVNPCSSVSIRVPKNIRKIRAIRVQKYHPHGKNPCSSVSIHVPKNIRAIRVQKNIHVVNPCSCDLWENNNYPCAKHRQARRRVDREIALLK